MKTFPLFPRRSQLCAKCRCKLDAGSEYASNALFKDSDWVRYDYCLDCWNKEKASVESGCFWRGKIPLKEKKGLNQNLIDLFISLCTSEQKSQKRLLYPLALYLERKKVVIRLKKQKSEPTAFELLKTGEIFFVEERNLINEDSATLLLEIQELLNV